jgi:ABC-type spermidine/putrescine transport system permease subunit I
MDEMPSVSRALVIVGAVLVAVLCLTSTMVAAIVGGLTILIVGLDVLAHDPQNRARADATPRTLTVDLRRRG